MSDVVPIHDTKRRLTVRSREKTEVNLDDVLTDGVIDIFPFVEKRGLLALSFRKRRVSITAGPYVGLILLTPSIIVDVRPKMPVANIARVLDVSRRSLEHIPGRDRYYRREDLASESVLEFLAANLLEALRDIEVNGLHKDYVEIFETSSHPVGSIDIGSTIRDCWSRGREHEVGSRRFDQTADIAINRTIKGALQSVLTQLGAFDDRRQALVGQLASALWHFPRTIRPHRTADVEIARRVVERNALPDFRSYYYRALSIAVMILSRRGIALEGDGEDALLGAFIVNFEDVFEEYLRNVLEGEAGNSVAVQNGKTDARKKLFDDSVKHNAEPDIVLLSAPAGRKLIVEVKYKDYPNRNDINQAITYAVTYRTDRVILVHQWDPATKVTRGFTHLGVMNGINLDTYAYDLGREDLEAEEKAFAAVMFARTTA